jgi:plastocyanin
MKNVSNTAQSQSSTVKSDKVSYDGSSFSPAAIDVKLGDTVTFTNNSSAGMWVASAPHPTHTDYPAFDAKKSYKTGESFSFTFDKVGSWKYHNHFSPSASGLVVVK